MNENETPENKNYVAPKLIALEESQSEGGTGPGGEGTSGASS